MAHDPKKDEAVVVVEPGFLMRLKILEGLNRRLPAELRVEIRKCQHGSAESSKKCCASGGVGVGGGEYGAVGEGPT